jgi:UDP-3-O-[3-hydroxymyristoyl] glucosamine N-acyltransferase
MTSNEIASIVNGELHGSPDVVVERVAEITRAGDGDLSFLEKASIGSATSAACVLVSLDYEPNAIKAPAVIKVPDPKLAFALAAEHLHPSKLREPEIHSSAVIALGAKIGAGVFIGAFCCVGESTSLGEGAQLRAGAKVGDNVTIGRNCVLHPNSFVDDGCSIGDHVILHSGVVVGADGFGYVRDKERYVKFPQIGTVVIEDDVEIGANTCIDRGALGETRIGAGTKIDNLVQIAHNVQIGKRVVIAAQTGISGSTIIEDDCVIGGQVGMGDHARVQSGAVIGSQAGVLPGKIVRPGVWWGTPVQPLGEYKRQNAQLKGIGRIKEEIANIKKRLPEEKKK